MVAVAVECVTAYDATAGITTLYTARIDRSCPYGVTLEDVSVDRDLWPCLIIVYLAAEYQRLCGVGRGMQPFRVQPVAIEAYCPNIGLGIIAAAEDAAGWFVCTVDISHRTKETL